MQSQRLRIIFFNWLFLGWQQNGGGSDPRPELCPHALHVSNRVMWSGMPYHGL